MDDASVRGSKKRISTKYALKISIVSRLFTTLLLFLGPILFKEFVHKRNTTVAENNISKYLSPFLNWDAEWYLSIAFNARRKNYYEHGDPGKCTVLNFIKKIVDFVKNMYTVDQQKAFFPLLPLIMVFVDKFINPEQDGNNLFIIVTLLLNNALFIKSCCNFEYILRLLKTKKFSTRTKYIAIYPAIQTSIAEKEEEKSEKFIKMCVTLFAFNPASVFFSVLYTESLFLFIVTKIFILWIRSEIKVNSLILSAELRYKSFYSLNTKEFRSTDHPTSPGKIDKSVNFINGNDLNEEQTKIILKRGITRQFLDDFIRYLLINIKLVAFISTATITRSNGIFLCGLGLYSSVFTTLKILRVPHTVLKYRYLFAVLNFFVSLNTIFVPLLVQTTYLNNVLGINNKSLLIFEYLHSLGTYSEIQSKFWSVGLFKYWRLSNIFRFVLAAVPAYFVFLMFANIFPLIFSYRMSRCGSKKHSSKSDSTPTTRESNCLFCLLKRLTTLSDIQFQIEFVFFIYLLALTLTVMLTANVEIITRVLFSSNPYIVVAMTRIFGVFSDVSLFKKKLFFCCLYFYFYWGILCFSLNYPWT